MVLKELENEFTPDDISCYTTRHTYLGVGVHCCFNIEVIPNMALHQLSDTTINLPH